MKKLTKNIIDKAFRSWEGPLTKELKLTQGTSDLGQIPERLAPETTTTIICGYCSTGCSLKVHLKDGEAVNLSADKTYPVNKGNGCPKGWEALTPLAAADRATKPLLRNQKGELIEVSWDAAMQAFAKNFKSVQEKYGKSAVAYLSTGQIPTEEMALLGALGKFGMGILHADGNTRQCMATAAVAYKQSFGFDAPPYTYKDFEESDVLVFVGANPCIAHPIMWQRVMANENNPEIIVVDPRKTETAVIATQHIDLLPKSDLVLFYGLANIFFQNQWIDKDFIEKSTEGATEFSEFVKDYTIDKVVSATGISEQQITKLAETIHNGKKVSFWWTMGVNQSYEGVRLAQSIINLALITGNIGKPGTGANSITGQCNAMGSRLYSNTTSLLGGHFFEKEEDRNKISSILEIDKENIPSENSLSYYEILDAIDEGKIKGLWIIATNTAHSWTNQNKFKKLREKLDFLVVQDMYCTTETAEMADLVLPAAGWGEKEGTFINSERRIGRIRKVKKAPGEALADFYILKLIAKYWGCDTMFNKWESPEKVFEVLQNISEGQPCDITGIEGYQMLEEEGGVQWPYPKGEVNLEQERRLFSDGKFYTNNGRAKILFEKPKAMPEAINNEYPYFLLTGRGTSSQWHTQTRTGKSEILKKLYPQDIYVEINAADAEIIGVEPEDMLEIKSRRGKITARAMVTSTVKKGQLFIPMHYKTTNQLTMDSFDTYSKQPSYKASAVSVEKL